MRRTATIWLSALIFGLAFGTTGLAQDEPPAAEEEKAPAAVEEKAAPDTPEDLAAVTGEKVEILLNSGIPISGVVKGHRVEILHGNRYVPSSDRKAKGAGIRIFHALGLNGFLFIPYATVEEIRFGGALTEEEGREIARMMKADNERAVHERARLLAEIEARKAEAAAAEEKGAEKAEGEAAEESGAPEPTGTEPAVEYQSDPITKATPDSDRLLKVRELLKRFPPEDWKPARLDEIKRRAIILNIYPSEEESAFMENYDLWREGYELWRKAQESAAEKDGGTSTAPDAAGKTASNG